MESIFTILDLQVVTLTPLETMIVALVFLICGMLLVEYRISKNTHTNKSTTTK